MTNTPITSKPKAKAVAKQVRAGLQLSPAYVKGRMRRFGGVRIGKGSDVYLAAAIEWLLREVTGGAMMCTLNQGALRIAPKHISDALHDDPALASHLNRGIMPHGRTYTPKERRSWTDRRPQKETEKE